MAATRTVIWGTSGHARVVADTFLCRGDDSIAGFIDDTRPGADGGSFLGRPVWTTRDVLPFLLQQGVNRLFIAFGHNRARLALGRELATMGFSLPTVVHPSAVVAHDAVLGPGTFVGPGAIVNAAARVGAFAIVNSGAILEHDGDVADGVHLSPRATLAGTVTVGECAWVGAAAVVREKLHIGADAIVGMGAVVTRSVASGVTVYGCPARIQQRPLQ